MKKILALGDDTHVRVAPAGLPDQVIQMRVSSHVSQRNRLRLGQHIVVSLVADAVVVLQDDPQPP